jgi:TPP-dependent pyruvate/acetoin dehydrogenase alpha subunit
MIDCETFDLGSLADPTSFQHHINVDAYSSDQLLNLYASLQRIRLAEYKIAAARKDGLIGGPVHLSIGQEAIAVGVASQLKPADRVFGAHRSHAHLLALGSSTYRLFAEVLGKDTGLSKGMGGSMHLWDKPHGFYGSVPIVAGTVALAVGAGLAAKMQNTNDVAVAYLGDGAIEEGVTHESLNLAKIMNIPIIFIVENNLFSSHMHISLRQPKDSTARFAKANNIDYSIVDGNDVISVLEAAKKMIDKARNGGGPGFIEAVTYRWLGHVDWRDDVDVGVCRSADEVNEWKKRDPILRLGIAMNQVGIINQSQQEKLIETMNSQIENDWIQATYDPYPIPSALISRVYAGKNHND